MSIDQSMFKPLGFTTHDLVQRLGKDVQEVFRSMAGIEDILPTQMQIEPVTDFEHSVTAMVGLAGTYNGIVCLHTPINLAMFFTASMLGTAVTEYNDDVQDALGEISNMIAGSLKNQLSMSGSDIKMSVPSVVTGDKYFCSPGNKSGTITLSFSLGIDLFLVGVTLNMNLPQ
jgi:chemotaxis protein CheX